MSLRYVAAGLRPKVTEMSMGNRGAPGGYNEGRRRVASFPTFAGGFLFHDEDSMTERVAGYRRKMAAAALAMRAG